MTSISDIDKIRDRLTQTRSLTVLTGAGVSADSGVPTFRGPEGLWKTYRAEELATPEAFSKNPGLVWEWYNWRRELIHTKEPNAAHAALASLEERIPSFTLITQNVDGLHVRAGSRNIVEIHGNIWKVRCTGCHTISFNDEIPLPPLPACDLCGEPLRPHVVWFGESLDAENIKRSLKAAEESELFLVVGTSGNVQPAASFAEIAKSNGSYIVEVNLDPTRGNGPADTSLTGRAAEILPRLL